MIVVVLIAVLYGVFINKMSTRSVKDKTQQTTLKTLGALLQNFPAAQRREVVCLEPCTECSVHLNGKALKETAFTLFKQPPTVLVRDRFGQFVSKSFLPYEDPKSGVKNVCFRYRLFRNGSQSSYIVQTDARTFYIFRPYMYPVEKVDSIETAQAAFDSEKLLPTERRNYDF